MKLYQTLKYKTYIILIYQVDGYYQSIICDKNNNCSTLISLYLTPYEASTYAKKRIDFS